MQMPRLGCISVGVRNEYVRGNLSGTRPSAGRHGPRAADHPRGQYGLSSLSAPDTGKRAGGRASRQTAARASAGRRASRKHVAGPRARPGPGEKARQRGFALQCSARHRAAGELSITDCHFGTSHR
ncbi:hypothetical protein C8Q77DRAFT_1088643 [Trametes polyzona]|nr:hypothetical protein C8Q77DRAFT_1088643 [Trametes polyzona]